MSQLRFEPLSSSVKRKAPVDYFAQWFTITQLDYQGNLTATFHISASKQLAARTSKNEKLLKFIITSELTRRLPFIQSGSHSCAWANYETGTIFPKFQELQNKINNNTGRRGSYEFLHTQLATLRQRQIKDFQQYAFVLVLAEHQYMIKIPRTEKIPRTDDDDGYYVKLFCNESINADYANGARLDLAMCLQNDNDRLNRQFVNVDESRFSFDREIFQSMVLTKNSLKADVFEARIRKLECERDIRSAELKLTDYPDEGLRDWVVTSME